MMKLRSEHYGLVPSILFLCCCPAFAGTWYAKVTATGTGDCLSWTNACTLPSALALATTGQVWVQAGEYDLTEAIRLKDGLKIIGGFAGTESSAIQAIPRLNPTILRGGGGTDPEVCGAAPLPIVYSKNNTTFASAFLRGFILEDGNSPGLDYVYCGGGAILIVNARPVIVDCIFRNNFAWVGGAIASYGATSWPIISTCTFYQNGIKDFGEPGEDYSFAGGAIAAWEGNAAIENSVFYNNYAREGGAVWVATTSNGYFHFRNNTIVSNVSPAGWGSGIAVSGQSKRVFVLNSILRDNLEHPIYAGYADIATEDGAVTVQYTNTPGTWQNGTGSIDTDPLFANSANHDYRIKAGSPCKNTGFTNFLSLDFADLDWDGVIYERLPYDRGWGPRLVQYYQPVDMGAYEVSCVLSAADCNANGKSDACELLDGDSLDCNENNVPDGCDITAGTSADCNGNGIPEECEGIPDCNSNVVFDSCDIQLGTSDDCNDNGVPDECDGGADCNSNGTLDSCDIAADPSLDCYNSNGVIDSCDFGIVRAACCVGSSCIFTTSCHCASLGGSWRQWKNCSQVQCIDE